MNIIALKESLSAFAGDIVKRTILNSQPLSPQIHLIDDSDKSQLFISNGSRLYKLSKMKLTRFKTIMQTGDEEAITKELISLGLDAPLYIDDKPLVNVPVHALSLAISQKCNMGCSYCYADQGSFGGPVKNMMTDTAKKSVDLLMKTCVTGSKVQLTFLGGEPLINRRALQETTEYCFQQAEKKNVQVGFSITTNGTLLKEEDALFFEKYSFAVTISLDGLGDIHNNLRPMKDGRGSYDLIIEKIKPLLLLQHNMQISARVTVTPDNLDLVEALNEFIRMGFHSVGFSPLLRSSSGKGEMNEGDLETMLAEMIKCGLSFEQNVLQGERFPFLNMVNALKEISKGTHRPYPCGAGAGYMGVSADGDLSACHRFVNEPAGKMGNLNDGINANMQNEWLSQRHVHLQDPCNKCWARYLCGGGCHHEVLAKGRNACNYIRGWLHYTIQAHERLSRLAPGAFY